MKIENNVSFPTSYVCLPSKHFLFFQNKGDTFVKTEIQSYIDKCHAAHNPNKQWALQLKLIFGSLVFFSFFGFIIYMADPEIFDWILNFYSNYSLFVHLALLFLLFLILKSTMKAMKREKFYIRQYEKSLNHYKSFADPLLADVTLLGSPFLFVYHIDGMVYDQTSNTYFWKDDHHAYFLEYPPNWNSSMSWVNMDDFTYFQMPIHSIRYFDVWGDKYYENKVSGGGSEGPNYVGAVVGNALFGTPGAIAGGQQKINKIESQLIVHDERKTRLVGMDINHRTIELYFNFEFFTLLDHHFPEKNKTIVDEISKIEVVQKHQAKPQTDISSKLERLDRFLKDGVISQEEYAKRKEKLVDEALS